MNIQRLHQRKWQYQEGDNYYEITISEELECWLNKPQYNPDFLPGTGIIKLYDQPIEKNFRANNWRKQKSEL